jgi:serine protease Do
MPLSFARARLGAAVAGAFLGGLVLASSFDLTRLGYAQQGASRPTMQEVKPLADQSNAFVAIAEHVTPAVVSIEATREGRQGTARLRGRVPPGMEDFFQQFDPRRQGPSEASGSGFIVSKDGYILTNNHVVEDADRVTVTLTDHRVFKAKVVGRDPTTDVAVIKIDGGSFPTIAIGDETNARIGEWVLAIGNPLGLDFTVTAGIISAKGRGGRELRNLLPGQYAISDFIQTDAAINPGNSGGPLVNIRGEVIGINGAIASPTGFYTGYGFAIPITLAKNVMDDIIRYGKVRRPVLGIAIDDVTPEDAQAAGLKTITGVKVGGFNPSDESPAEKAGVEPGDVIVAIDGKAVDRVSALQRIVRTHEPGETVAIDVMRYGNRKSFRVKLSEAPPDEQAVAQEPRTVVSPAGMVTGKLGIAVEPVAPDFVRENSLTAEQRGLRVTDVQHASPAFQKLFEGSDVITEILYPGPRRPVRAVADLQQALDRLKNGDVISLFVLSVSPQGQSTRVVNLRVGG